jgi:hypothetical protein
VAPPDPAPPPVPAGSPAPSPPEDPDELEAGSPPPAEGEEDDDAPSVTLELAADVVAEALCAEGPTSPFTHVSVSGSQE